jgi:radical SAM protein with 4Fe4S-binding SPASM domain
MKWHEPPFVLRELKIEVTYSCPLVCIHCSSDAAPNIVAEIEKNKCLDIIEQAINLEVQEIAFSGGEPLNYKPLLNCVQKCSEGKIFSTIYTTGINDSFPSLIKELKTTGLNRAVFSLYSSRAEIHERITRKENSYKRTIEAIQMAKSIGLETEVHFVALKTNLHDLSSVVDIAKSLDISRVSVLRFVPQGRGSINLKELLDRRDYLYLKKEIEQLRKDKFDLRTGSPFNFLLVNKSPSCKSAIDRLIINPHLDIFPCDAFKQMSAKELVGSDEYSNLSKYSLEDCWKKSPFLNEVRHYLTTDFPETCSDCNLLEKCLSGCLAQKVLKQGNFKKCSDPDCIKLN